MKGQSLVEYLLIVGLFSLAIALGADSPLQQLLGALGAHLEHYTFTLSRP